MEFIEIIKAIIFGIVEGVTEWLPISSTGHLILLDSFINLDAEESFKEMFNVVIQLGAILAVVLLYFDKLNPFSNEKGILIKKETISMWLKIVVSCIPAAIIGLKCDDLFNDLFYNEICVSLALIVFGVLFIIVENFNKNQKPKITSISQITYKVALLIGVFQLIAAIFPGTSRSGATIVGALLIGVSRSTATEFTFFLAVPVMFGASLLKLVKFGFHFTSLEAIILGVGTIVSFVVSILAIKFLVGYIKKHDFKVFGWYRIVLGIFVISYYFLTNLN